MQCDGPEVYLVWGCADRPSGQWTQIALTIPVASGIAMNSLSPSRTVPDPTPVLFLIAISLALTPFVADESTRLLLLGAILLPAGLWMFQWLTVSAEAGIALLVLAAAIPRGSVDVGGLNARPEHVAAGLLCLALPLLMRRTPREVPWIFADYLLAAYVGLNILSSILMSPEPSQTLKWSVQQTLAILPYFFLRVLAADERGIRRAFRVFLLVGALAAAYGVVSYYSNFFLGTEFGVGVDQYGAIPATYGTQYEANILGAYCGACSVAMLAMYVQEKRKIYLVGYAITLAGMAVSLSRGALGATLIGLAVLAYSARKLGLLDRRIVLRAGMATLWVCILILPVLAARYSERLSTLDVTDPSADENTLVRLVQFAAAVENIANSPVLGNGTASFQLLFAQETAETDIGAATPWIANSELRILHDTGVVGFAVFVLFIGSLARQSLRRLKHTADPVLLALLVSAVVYAASFQATEGTILAFTWVHLGLIACAVAVPRSLESYRVAEVRG
jgi:O-antigen ligase